MKLTVQGVKNFLQWKWIKKASIYALTSGWPLGTAEVVVVVASFLVVYAFTNWSSPTTYGTYRYYMAIVSILSIFSLPGVNTAVTTSVAAGKKGILIPSVWLRFRYTLIASVVIVVAGIYFMLSGKYDLAIAMIVSSVLLPLYMSLDTVFAFLLGKSAFKEVSIARVINTVITTLVIIVLIRVYPNSPFWIILGNITVTSIMYGLSCYWAIKLYGEDIHIGDNTDVERYGKQLTWRGLIGMVETRLDLLIIGSFFSFEQLAVFSVGRLFKDLLSRTWRLFYSLLLPRLSERKTIPPRLTLRLLLSFVGLFSLIGGALIFIIPFLIPFLFTEVYQESVVYAQAFAGLAIIGTVGAVLEAQFASRQQITYLFSVRIGSALTYLTALIVCVPLFKIVGIIVALFFRALAYSGIALWFWYRDNR